MSEMRSRRLICGIRRSRLSSGLRQRMSPMISHCVWSIRYSARCEPTMPLIPVMNARFRAKVVIPFLRSSESTQAHECFDLVVHVVPCRRIDGLMVSEGDAAFHDMGRMAKVAHHS